MRALSIAIAIAFALLSRLLVMTLAVSALACGNTGPAPFPSTSAPPVEQHRAAPVQADPAFLPAQLADDAGVAFAETQGGSIAVSGGSIKDGTIFTITAVNHIVEHDKATVEVEIAGKRHTVPANVVLREARLKRSPDRSFAVFAIGYACPDACHDWIYVLDRSGKRKRLGDAWADHAIAWRADGAEVAVGGSELWIVALPGLDVRAVAGYTAPAYAADGTLYVRDLDGSAFTLGADGKVVRVWKAPRRSPDERDQGRFAGVNPPVSFDRAGKPRFER